MAHRELISTYFKDDIYGSRAEVYRITESTVGLPSFFSIAYFNSNDAMLKTKHFTNSTLDYVEAEAENWTLEV